MNLNETPLERFWRPLVAWGFSSLLLAVYTSNFLVAPYLQAFAGISVPYIQIDKNLVYAAFSLLGIGFGASAATTIAKIMKAGAAASKWLRTKEGRKFEKKAMTYGKKTIKKIKTRANTKRLQSRKLP